MIKKILSSNILHFIVTRYLGYGIQFLNTLLFAKYLGAFYLGVYGFITLLLQYLSYSNFGLHYALNFFLSVKNRIELDKKVYSNVLFLNVSISISLIILFSCLSFLDINIFSKYNLNEYFFLIGIIASFQILNQLFVNVFRTYGKLWEINFHQLVIPLLQLPGFLFLEKNELLIYILWMNLIGNLLSIVVFSFKNPFKFKLAYNRKIWTIVTVKGLNLLIYNISFYLIMLSGRTLVGIFYSVEDMGQYSLGTNLASAVMMVMGSLSFLFFSKMINKFSNFRNSEETILYIEKSRKVYFTLTLLIGLFFFIIIPFLSQILNEYISAFKIFQILLISQIIIANSFGYTTLLVAQKKEMVLSKIAFGTILINILLSSVFLTSQMTVEFMAYSTLLSVFFYNIMSVYKGMRHVNQEIKFFKVIKYLFPIETVFVIILMFCSVVLEFQTLGIVAFLIYGLIKRKELYGVFLFGINKIVDKKALDF